MKLSIFSDSSREPPATSRVDTWARRHANLLTSVGACSLIVFLLVGAESALRVRHWFNTRTHPEVVKSSLHDLVLPDPVLSYRPKASASVVETCAFGDLSVYSARYTTDEYGRRTTIVPNDSGPRPCLALFFGCSFAFGIGVQDDQTLPSQFAACQECLLPLNYGFGGWGPQQTWLLLGDSDLARRVPVSKGTIAFYVFIDNHLSRLIGTQDIIAGWRYPLPWLRLAGGQVVHSGSFRDRSLCGYYLVRATSGLHLLRFIESRLPRKEVGPAIDAETRDLFLHVMKESSEKAKALQMEFCVLIFPGSLLASQFVPALEASDIKCLDYSELFTDIDMPQSDLFFEDAPSGRSGHPKPMAVKIVAERLAEDVPRLFPNLAEKCGCQ